MRVSQHIGRPRPAAGLPAEERRLARLVSAAFRPPSNAASSFARQSTNMLAAAIGATGVLIIVAGITADTATAAGTPSMPAWLLFAPAVTVAAIASVSIAVTVLGHLRQRRALRRLCVMEAPQAAHAVFWMERPPTSNRPQFRQRLFSDVAAEFFDSDYAGKDMTAATFAGICRTHLADHDFYGVTAASAAALATGSGDSVAEMLAVVSAMSSHPHLGVLLDSSAGNDGSFASIRDNATIVLSQPLAVTEIAAGLSSKSPGTHTAAQWLEIAELIATPVVV